MAICKVELHNLLVNVLFASLLVAYVTLSMKKAGVVRIKSAKIKVVKFV